MSRKTKATYRQLFAKREQYTDTLILLIVFGILGIFWTYLMLRLV